MRRSWMILPALVTTLAALGAAVPAQAQLLDMLKKALPAIPGGSPASPRGPATASVGPDPADAPSAGPSEQALSELSPDVACRRPRERFNIGEKLVTYGGTAATLRLQRLIETDFEFSNLDANDKLMLKYLAQTTVWLPAEAEAKLGSIYDGASGLRQLFAGPNDLERAGLDMVGQRLAPLKLAVADYPAEVRLVLNKKLADGAFARFGGVIQLSTNFLNGLVEAGAGADYLLAHEISHVYRRHAVKNLQFLLISSGEGWNLARKVLKRAMRGIEVDPLGDGVFLLTTMPQIIELVQRTQNRFGSDQELEADACAVVWLKAIDRDPAEAWTQYHQILGASASYSAEHPSSEERSKRFLAKAGDESLAADQAALTKGSVKALGEALVETAGPNKSKNKTKATAKPKEPVSRK